MRSRQHGRVGSSNLTSAFNTTGRGFPFPTVVGGASMLLSARR